MSDLEGYSKKGSDELIGDISMGEIERGSALKGKTEV
jgi:hypothetical protein